MNSVCINVYIYVYNLNYLVGIAFTRFINSTYCLVSIIKKKKKLEIFSIRKASKPYFVIVCIIIFNE